jgi:hypothetical protein
MTLLLIGITIGVVVTHLGHFVTLALARAYTQRIASELRSEVSKLVK